MYGTVYVDLANASEHSTVCVSSMQRYNTFLMLCVWNDSINIMKFQIKKYNIIQ